MKMTEKLERAAGTFLTLNDRTDFDLEPVCKLLKQAHDYILELETELAALRVQSPQGIEEAYKAGWRDGRVSASAYGPEPDWRRWKAREVSHD